MPDPKIEEVHPVPTTYVIPLGDGIWEVQDIQTGDRAAVFDSQNEAMDYAKEWDRRCQKWRQEGDDNTRDVLRTPDEWCRLRGMRVLDPDGWRHADAPAWDTPIIESEFNWRFAESTVGPA